MKEKFQKHRKLWITIIASVLLLAVITTLALSFLSGTKIMKKVSVEEAQKIVDTAFDNIAKITADGAITILNNTSIKVNSVAYGNEKDLILSCSYEALDVKGCISDHIEELVRNAYTFYVEGEASGKKPSATKVSGAVNKDILARLETATPISGEVTIYVYETIDGMQLYLQDEMVNTVTGGLLDVIDAIKNTTTIEYKGETIDITNKVTPRTGLVECIALENYSNAKPLTGNRLTVAWAEFKDEFNRNFLQKARWKYLADGLLTTLSITFFAALLGIFLGFVIAVVRCTNQMIGKLKFPDMICRVYLTIMRGTPVMVQLLILFFVFLLPLKVDKFVAAVICFGLNSGAYVAEIVRGGIMSIDKGQIEAGRSLGFNYVQTMVHFVIPQAFKAILPALANEFITLLKESSVAFYIGVADLTAGGLKIRSITYSNFMPLIAVAVIYLILVMILTKLVSILERRLAKSDH